MVWYEPSRMVSTSSPDTRPRRRMAVLKATIFLAVACGICIVLFSLTDLSQLRASLAQARPRPLLALLLLQALSAFLRAERLHRILGDRLPFNRVFHSANTGNMVNSLIPLRAGEFCTTFLLAGSLRNGVGEALSKVFVDRLLDLVAVVLLFIVMALFLPADMTAASELRGAAVLCAAALPAAWLLLFLLTRFQTPTLGMLKLLISPLRFLPWDSLESRIRSSLNGFGILFRLRDLLPLLCRSLLIWTTITASYYIGMTALFPPPSFWAAVLAMSFTVVGLMTMAAPAGIGTTHGAIVVALSLFGVPVDQGLAFALIYHAMGVGLNVTLGLIGAKRLNINAGRLLRQAVRRGMGGSEAGAGPQ